MSQSSISFGLPASSIRAGFESAARTHAAVRESGGLPVSRQAIAAAQGTPVEAAIANAARATTVDFNYLLAQAEVESAMNPSARAATSSATGLYQFIDSTWLSTVKQHGERFGLGALADEIALTPSGSPHVADPAQRAAILALRNDPHTASLMAAGLAEDNRAHLAPILGRQPDHSELYLAHFLGAGGAGRFLSEMQANPGQSAPALFAKPAAANRAIFYSANGSPRSLAQVMEVIEGKLDRALDRVSVGKAARFAQADYAPSAAPRFTAAQYSVGDQGGFDPGLPPAPGMGSFAAVPPRPSPQSMQRPSMSQVLGSAFGGDPSAAPAQVRRAYTQLKAFGL